MNLGQLEVFVAIANSGSLKKGAEAVGLTHSAVSYSLSKLEAELGVKLLDRGKHGITLTRIGEVVLSHARNIIAELEIIRQQTSRERGLHVGKIRFACVPQVPSRLLTGIIREFQHQYPDIEVVLFQGHETEVLEWLDNRLVDAGTVMQPNGYPLAVPFLEDQIYVLLPKDHRLAQEPRVGLQYLENEPLIGRSREVEATTELNPTSAFRTLQLQYQVTETQTAVAMVAEGMGITMVPRMVLEDVADEKIV
ncbi:MAG: LysR family transcriptional regulator, partial [Anaerolineae bacterium]|nr:LysR family transcriptional regulator [Anaerolineae bacterium]